MNTTAETAGDLLRKVRDKVFPNVFMEDPATYGCYLLYMDHTHELPTDMGGFPSGPLIYFRRTGEKAYYVSWNAFWTGDTTSSKSLSDREERFAFIEELINGLWEPMGWGTCSLMER